MIRRQAWELNLRAWWLVSRIAATLLAYASDRCDSLLDHRP